jgi:hypothetical protein
MKRGERRVTGQPAAEMGSVLRVKKTVIASFGAEPEKANTSNQPTVTVTRPSRRVMSLYGHRGSTQVRNRTNLSWQ